MTSKFRDIAAKHRERRMRVRRREMAFAASQANHQHRSSSSLVPTGQVVSHMKDCNPHDVDVCSSISVSSYGDDSKDEEDDNVTNDTFGETISESNVEEDEDESPQPPPNHNGLLTNKKHTRHVTATAAPAHRRLGGRSPMPVKKNKTAAPRISVNVNKNSNPPRDDRGKEPPQQPKMTSPSWANVKLKKTSMNNSNSGNDVVVGNNGAGDKNTDHAAAVNPVLTPRTRGGSGGGVAAAAGSSSSSHHQYNNNNNNNKQRVVRASGTGSSRRRFKSSSYADRRPTAIVQSSPKMAVATASPRIMTTTLRQTGSSFLKESSMSPTAPPTAAAATAPVAQPTSTIDVNVYEFHEEKKEEHENLVVVLVPATRAPATSTTITTLQPPPPAWSIQLKSTTANDPSSSNKTAAITTDAAMTMMIEASDDSQELHDSQQQPIPPPPPPSQTTSINTSTTTTTTSSSSCSNNLPPPAAWSIKLKSTWATKNDKKLKTRVASALQQQPEKQPSSSSTSTTIDAQSPQTLVSPKHQVAGSKTTAPAYHALRVVAPIIATTTTTPVVNTAFAALAWPVAATTTAAAAAAATATTPKPVEVVASPAWAQVKLKTTGFDVVEERPVDAEPPTGPEIAHVTEATNTLADVALALPAAAQSTPNPAEPLVSPAWAQLKLKKTGFDIIEDKPTSYAEPPTGPEIAVVTEAAKSAREDSLQSPAAAAAAVVVPMPRGDDDKKLQPTLSAPPAWTLRKLKSSIEHEIIIDHAGDKPVVVLPTPKKIDQTTTTLTPRTTTSMNEEKNQRRSIRTTAPSSWIQSNKGQNAAENEHDQASAHDDKATAPVVPTPTPSSTGQDQSKPPPPKMTGAIPLPQGEKTPIPVWAQISLKKTGIDVAEQHPLEKQITVNTKEPAAVDKQQPEVVKESSTPRVQLSTNLTPKVERFGGSGGPLNPTVNLPVWAQTTLLRKTTANDMSDDSRVYENVQKAKGIATENNAQLVVPRAAVDDAGDAAAAAPPPLTQTYTGSSDAEGERFSTTMAPWIRAKLKKKVGSDTTVEIWPEDEESSNSFATNRSPTAATQTSNLENHRGAPPPSSTPAAWPLVKLRKTGLFNKELDTSAAAPTKSTPIADVAIVAKPAPTLMSVKMAPTPMSVKLAPTPMSISSNYMGTSIRPLTSPLGGPTNRTRVCADGTGAESYTPVPTVVALDAGNDEDQITPPQPVWLTMKLRKTGIEVVEPTPGDERVVPDKGSANSTHRTVLTVSAAPEERCTSSIREPTPRANAKGTTPNAAAARAKTPVQSDSDTSSNNFHSSPWPITMLKKTGFDVVTDKAAPPHVESTPTGTVERMEENNNAKAEAVIVVRRASVVVISPTPKNAAAAAPIKNVMESIDEMDEPVSINNPWSMMKLKKTGFDVREEEALPEPSLQAKDSVSTVVDPIVEVNRIAVAAKVVVEEPEQQEDCSDEPAGAGEECETGRQQPVWAKLKLKKTGKVEKMTKSIAPEASDSDAAGKVSQWKKARSNMVV
jgi:hypothetical protein